jgi:hypothetical protein
MHELLEQFKRLPKVAKIGIPVALAAIAYYVYSKNKSNSSGTSSETVATGAGDTTGSSSSGSVGETNIDTGTGSTTSTSTTTPIIRLPATGGATKKKVSAWTLAWRRQAAANARKLGIKDTLKKGATGDEAKAYAEKLAKEINPGKGHKTTDKTTSSKSRSVATVHSNKVKHESPRIRHTTPHSAEAEKAKEKKEPVVKKASRINRSNS